MNGSMPVLGSSSAAGAGRAAPAGAGGADSGARGTPAAATGGDRSDDARSGTGRVGGTTLLVKAAIDSDSDCAGGIAAEAGDGATAEDVVVAAGADVTPFNDTAVEVADAAVPAVLRARDR